MDTVESADFKLSFEPPPGWRIPSADVPSGTVFVTVEGLPPKEAPALIMVRAVDCDGESFDAYCERELNAMARSFADGTVTELRDLVVPASRWRAVKAVSTRRLATLTLIEQPEFFVWFGLLVDDPAWFERVPALYRTSLASFGQKRKSADV